MHSLEEHLIEGSILAAAIVFAFLANIRTTLISALAIPTSIVSTFALMAAIGFDLNQITMLALTLMVGIVIDDAIIVLENIYRFMEEKGMSPYQAAIEGTKDIGLAVMATTLSLLAVFLPIRVYAWYRRPIHVLVWIHCFVCHRGLALLVFFTLTPMLTSRFVKVLPHREGDEEARAQRFALLPFPGWATTTSMLEWSMAHRKTMVVISVAVVLSTVPLFMLVGKNFIPADDRSEFQASVRAPEGTSLAATVTIAERIARDIRALPGVTSTLTSVGIGSASFTGSSAGEANSASMVYVKLVPRGDRKDTQDQMMAKAREILKHYPKDLRTTVGQAADGPGGGQSDVHLTLTGPDLDQLEFLFPDAYSRS